MRQVLSVPGFYRRTPIIALAQGPESEGIEGRHPWATWVDILGQWHLGRVGVAGNPDLLPRPSYTQDVNPLGFRALSLAFDQNNRRVIAWQTGSDLEATPPQITLSYIQTGVPETEQRVSWSGLDPQLFWDKTLLEETLTDIICFYLSSDRLSIKYRLQSDVYGTEYHYLTLPEPMTLVRWKILALEVSLVLVNAAGQTFETKASGLYPLYIADTAHHQPQLEGGAYNLIIRVLEPFTEGLTDQPRLGSGLYQEGIVVRDDLVEGLSDILRIGAGSYRLQGQEFDTVREAMPYTPRLGSGLYYLVYVSSGDPRAEASYQHIRLDGELFERTIVRDPYGESVPVHIRLGQGAYRDVNVPFDPLAEAVYSSFDLTDSFYTQRVFGVTTVPPETVTAWGRLSQGTLREQVVVRDIVTDSAHQNFALSGSTAETQYIQRILEAAAQNQRLATGLYNFVTYVTPDAAHDGAMLSVRLGGNYLLFSGLDALVNFQRFFDTPLGNLDETLAVAWFNESLGDSYGL